MCRNTCTFHHAQTMTQYTIPYMHSSSAEILWLRMSEADVWTVVLQVYNKHTQLVISIWLPPPQQPFSCCCVPYLKGAKLIPETMQHNEEVIIEHLPIICLPPPSVWLVYTHWSVLKCNLVTRGNVWQEASRTDWTIKACSMNFELWCSSNQVSVSQCQASFTIRSSHSKSIGHHPISLLPKPLYMPVHKSQLIRHWGIIQEYIIKLTWSNCESLNSSSCAYTTNLYHFCSISCCSVCLQQKTMLNTRCASSGRWQ